MRTTAEKYNKLCDMNLIQSANYDINARIELILADIQRQLKKFEDEAIAIYADEKNLKKVSENPKVC